jgi:hypothetical protein
LVPNVHVEAPPETHADVPGVQLFVQVSAHAAFGAWPEHTSGLTHVEVVATYGQLFVSTAHVASVCPSWQTVAPAALFEQIEASQTHDAAVALVAVHV